MNNLLKSLTERYNKVLQMHDDLVMHREALVKSYKEGNEDPWVSMHEIDACRTELKQLGRLIRKYTVAMENEWKQW